MWECVWESEMLFSATKTRILMQSFTHIIYRFIKKECLGKVWNPVQQLFVNKYEQKSIGQQIIAWSVIVAYSRDIKITRAQSRSIA